MIFQSDIIRIIFESNLARSLVFETLSSGAKHCPPFLSCLAALRAKKQTWCSKYDKMCVKAAFGASNRARHLKQRQCPHPSGCSHCGHPGTSELPSSGAKHSLPFLSCLATLPSAIKCFVLLQLCSEHLNIRLGVSNVMRL